MNLHTRCTYGREYYLPPWLWCPLEKFRVPGWRHDCPHLHQRRSKHLARPSFKSPLLRSHISPYFQPHFESIVPSRCVFHFFLRSYYALTRVINSQYYPENPSLSTTFRSRYFLPPQLSSNFQGESRAWACRYHRTVFPFRRS